MAKRSIFATTTLTLRENCRVWPTSQNNAINGNFYNKKNFEKIIATNDQQESYCCNTVPEIYLLKTINFLECLF